MTISVLLLGLLAISETFAASLPPGALRPFVDYEPVKTVFIGNTARYDLSETQKALIDNMPVGIKVVIGQELWLRDVSPYPLVSTTNPKIFSQTMPPQGFENGNLVADKNGHCFSVDVPELTAIPQEILKSNYGCKKIHILPMWGGIGHADERMIFLSDTLAATDRPEIEKILKDLGYQVLLLPFIDSSEQPFTYLNSLIVNDHLFVPQYEMPTDKEALEIFATSGMKVIPVPSKILSENGAGSIHCITRTYPK